MNRQTFPICDTPWLSSLLQVLRWHWLRETQYSAGLLRSILKKKKKKDNLGFDNLTFKKVFTKMSVTIQIHLKFNTT